MSRRVDMRARACDAKRRFFSHAMIRTVVDAVCCIDVPLVTLRKVLSAPQATAIETDPGIELISNPYFQNDPHSGTTLPGGWRLIP